MKIKEMSILSKLFPKKSNAPQGISLEIKSAFSGFGGSAYQNAAFRAAVDAISRHCAKLKAHAGLVDPNARKYTGEVTNKNVQNPQEIERLLQTAPNPHVSAFDLLYKTATAFFARNNSFILIQRGAGGIEAFYNLAPSSVEFIGNLGGELYSYMTLTWGRQVTLPYSDLIHLRRHFNNSELLGSDNAPLYPLLETSETLTQAAAKAAQNAVNIRGILKFSSLVNPQQVKLENEQFVKDYMNLSNSGGVAATDQRFDFVPTNSTPYSVPAEQMNAVNSQIYSYLGISPEIVDGTFSEDEFQSFYESVVEPFALQLSLEFSRKCGIDIN
ncbi:MAG: phage portal protein, partial [Clostridiales bacterium]|nr:phage portal protein [Clostridiales bacterium]